MPHAIIPSAWQSDNLVRNLTMAGGRLTATPTLPSVQAGAPAKIVDLMASASAMLPRATPCPDRCLPLCFSPHCHGTLNRCFGTRHALPCVFRCCSVSADFVGGALNRFFGTRRHRPPSRARSAPTLCRRTGRCRRSTSSPCARAVRTPFTHGNRPICAGFALCYHTKSLYSAVER